MLKSRAVFRLASLSFALYKTAPPHDAYTDLLLQSVPEMEVGWLEQALETRRMAAAGH